jgi:cytochrome P450
VVTDPLIARHLLGDGERLSLLGEGGVGHLWAQLLGDWVNQAFDGPGHAELRGRGRDLFTDAGAKRHVKRVFASSASAVADRLHRGETVDVAMVARTWVGRMVADLLGLQVDASLGDRAYLEIFARGERLAVLARRTLSSTVMPPALITEAKDIVEELTGCTARLRHRRRGDAAGPLP